jgi:hypothetical protein
MLGILGKRAARHRLHRASSFRIEAETQGHIGIRVAVNRQHIVAARRKVRASVAAIVVLPTPPLLRRRFSCVPPVRK